MNGVDAVVRILAGILLFSLLYLMGILLVISLGILRALEPFRPFLRSSRLHTTPDGYPVHPLE